jgi:hypothetical protein
MANNPSCVTESHCTCHLIKNALPFQILVGAQMCELHPNFEYDYIDLPNLQLIWQISYL